jgi:hypothetical protein
MTELLPVRLTAQGIRDLNDLGPKKKKRLEAGADLAPDAAAASAPSPAAVSPEAAPVAAVPGEPAAP